MNETLFYSWLGKTVEYDGIGRPHLRCHRFTVIEENKVSAGFYSGEVDITTGQPKLTWCAKSRLKIIETGKPEDYLEAMFSTAEGGKVAAAKHEIERLEARIAELKKFVEVYNSL